MPVLESGVATHIKEHCTVHLSHSGEYAYEYKLFILIHSSIDLNHSNVYQLVRRYFAIKLRSLFYALQFEIDEHACVR